MSGARARIAIVGLDHWYSALLLIPAFARESRLEIAGIAHRDLARAQQVADRNGISEVADDPAAMIDDPTIAGLVLFTSTDMTPSLCLAAAQVGKHVLAAKPVARRLSEATEVLSAVRAMGVHLLPGETLTRWGPADFVREQVREGLLGKVVSARCSHSAGLPQAWPDDPSPGWFVDPARCAGGGWIDHAIYQIDRLRWVLDDEVESVRGTIATAGREALGVEDWGVALVRFESGVLADLRADWFMPTTAMFQNQWELAGTRGAIRVDDVANQVSIAKVPVGDASLSDWSSLRAPDVDLAATVAGHFADVLAGASEPRACVEDAWRNLAVAAAFYEASATGQPTRVKEMPRR